eukprot:GHUV01030946.1.p1 GENE.GHUV01030946.1~~GHUV01030946.1.p1  ORF type:complete len:106 (-),score=26.48 GHUV01030946.1:313-630(-)
MAITTLSCCSAAMMTLTVSQHMCFSLLLQFVYDGVGKSTFDSSLKSLDYLGWMISFGNASGKPEPFDLLRSAHLVMGSDCTVAGALLLQVSGEMQQMHTAVHCCK